MTAPLKAAKLDNIEKARTAWGETLPDWVVVLAESCQKMSQSAVAKIIDYSPAVVSSVLSNTYRGDVSAVETATRTYLMKETIQCPKLGSIERKDCLNWQAKPFAATNSHRVQMYRACRSNCPNSLIGGNDQ